MIQHRAKLDFRCARQIEQATAGQRLTLMRCTVRPKKLPFREQQNVLQRFRLNAARSFSTFMQMMSSSLMQAKKKKNVKLKFRNRELKPDGFENDKLATYNVEWHNGE